MKRASRVSTCTSSPLSRYDGTWITSPVSSVAGLVCACAVAPFTAGAVSTTCEHDRVRQLDRDHLVVEEHRADAAHAVLQIAADVAEVVGRERELLVRLRVHEVEAVVVAVEELDRPELDVRLLDLVAAAEGLVEDLARS